MKQIFHLKNPLKRDSYNNLPSSNGVYVFKKSSEYLYIGKSVNIKARILSHLESAKLDRKEKSILSNATDLTVIITENEFAALILESQLIQKYHPKYNVIWRDGKSYLYIKITDETFPKVYAVRKEPNQKGLYFGPFSSARDVEYLINTLRKIVPFCTQKRITRSRCFYSKIGLCDPCPNYINKLPEGELKTKLSNHYKNNIRRLTTILKGRTRTVLSSLYALLRDCIKKERYEEGINLRKKIAVLENLLHSRSFSKNTQVVSIQTDNFVSGLFNLLKNFFPNLKSLKRIECFDVSNLMQKQATSSMAVFTNGVPDKKEYRKFKIKHTDGGSDFEMLQETLNRRFSYPWPKPDLLLVDGGKPQVRMVVKTLSELHQMIPVVGLAKHPDRLIIGNHPFKTVRLKPTDSALKILQHARDESHRFARKYHLFLRNRSLLYNELKE